MCLNVSFCQTRLPVSERYKITYLSGLRSTWPCTQKLDREKSKHGCLAQQNGFGQAFWCSLLRLAAFLLPANFCQIPFLKNMIWTYRKDFPWKKWPKKNFCQSPDFYFFPIGSQEYRKILIFSYFHISTCGQIWPNRFQDDSHLGYITKLEKETPVVGERHGKCRHLRKVQWIWFDCCSLFLIG